MVELIAHLVLALAVLGAYVSLTIAGHDGTALLGMLGGQAAAVGVQKLTEGTKR